MCVYVCLFWSHCSHLAIDLSVDNKIAQQFKSVTNFSEPNWFFCSAKQGNINIMSSSLSLLLLVLFLRQNEIEIIARWSWNKMHKQNVSPNFVEFQIEHARWVYFSLWPWIFTVQICLESFHGAMTISFGFNGKWICGDLIAYY